MNCIACWQGKVYALLNQCGAIVNLSEARTVVADIHLRGAHNLLIQKDGTAVTNDTHRGYVRRYDLQSGALVWSLSLREHRWVRSMIRWSAIKHRAGLAFTKLRPRDKRKKVARPLFVRGLAICDNLLFVGFSPAAILCVDLQTGRFIDGYRHSHDVHLCIHGLCVMADR
jgi:hypothetical protein